MEKIKYECIWNPCANITTYELARCIPYLYNRFFEIEDWDKLDTGITRHFDVSKFDYGKMINDNAKKLKGLLR